MSLLERTGISVQPTPAQGSADGVFVDVSTSTVMVSTFAAGETITNHVATIATLPAYEDKTATVIDTSSIQGGNTVVVTMSGFVRGVSYLLVGTATNAAGVSWSWTLGIRCVA